MMPEPPDTARDPITRAIWAALAQEVKTIVEQQAIIASDEVRAKIRSKVGSIMTKVAQHFTFEYGQSQIVIRVDFNDVTDGQKPS